VTSLAKVMCSRSEQQAPLERIALVHSKAEGAGGVDSLSAEIAGLVEGLVVTLKDGLKVGLETR
jgi:hypothetical protein